jgi:hypothetical protein
MLNINAEKLQRVAQEAFDRAQGMKRWQSAITREEKDARLIRRLSAVLSDPKREDEHRAILVTLNDLSNTTGVSDLHPEIFPTLSRAVIRAAREQARGRSETARRMARYLRGLEMLAGE